jgi:site-specific DNA recombinase
MYIALYPRVSTGQQVTKGTSLEGQIDSCMKKAKELAKQIGYKEEQIKIYREDGFSGEDIDIRPAMSKLRQDVADGLISHVIVQHPDRLSRDLTDKLIVCREFEKYGVEFLFVDTEFEKTPEGILFFNIISSIASYELALIKKRTVRGRLRAVEEKKKVMPMRVAPYGYDLVNGELTINKEEAIFVRKIYNWYIDDHLTLREIGEKLYALGAVPKRKESRNWSASSIRRILTSEVYIGKYYYNRRKTNKVKGEKTAAGNPKKTYEIREEEEWISVDVPPIVDSTTYEMAQSQKKKNITKSGNVKYEYLLKGLIKCKCGRTWQATAYSGRVNKETGQKTKYLSYRCPNKTPKRYGPEVHKCNTPSIRADQLENYIWNLIVETLSNPDDYRVNLLGNTNEVIDELNEQIDSRNKQLLSKEKKKEKLKLLFLEDLISQEEMKRDVQKINTEMKNIIEEIGKYQNKIQIHEKQTITNERMNSLIKTVRSILTKDGEEGLTLNDKRNIIDKLIDEIHIDFGIENEVIIKTVGALDEFINDIGLSSQREKI